MTLSLRSTEARAMLSWSAISWLVNPSILRSAICRHSSLGKQASKEDRGGPSPGAFMVVSVFRGWQTIREAWAPGNDIRVSARSPSRIRTRPANALLGPGAADDAEPAFDRG